MKLLQCLAVGYVPDSGLKRAGERTVQAIVNAATGAALFAR
jgi:hypothetical protein